MASVRTLLFASSQLFNNMKCAHTAKKMQKNTLQKYQVLASVCVMIMFRRVVLLQGNCRSWRAMHLENHFHFHECKSEYSGFVEIGSKSLWYAKLRTNIMQQLLLFVGLEEVRFCVAYRFAWHLSVLNAV